MPLSANGLFICRVVDVKQKNLLFTVQGKFCLVLFHSFCTFVFRNLGAVNEMNANFTRVLSKF